MATGTEPELHRATAEESGDQETLVVFLEPDQLVDDKSRAVPRVRLSARASAALWVLRVFVLIVAAMVIYTFFSQLAR
jgi:hypothetical protein